MTDVRYIAVRFNRDGTQTLVDPDVPLQGASVTTVLSGPGGLSGSLAPVTPRLLGPDGQPLLTRYSTGIYAVTDTDEVLGGGIITQAPRSGDSMSVTCVGHSALPKNEPYPGDVFFVKTDPLDIVRHIWQVAQSRDGFGPVITVDQVTKVGVLIGEKLTQVEFDTQAGPVAFEAGPYKLSWWETDDMGGRIDDLAGEYFDYRETVTLADADDPDQIVNLGIEFAVPRFGTRRHALRFVEGENIVVAPSEEFADDAYADYVVVRGAGEGRTMIRGFASRAGETRLARGTVIEDKQIKSVTKANRRAARELARLTGERAVSSLAVHDSDGARLGSWGNGDDILVALDSDWGASEAWYRVLSTTINPEDTSIVALSVMRADMIPA